MKVLGGRSLVSTPHGYEEGEILTSTEVLDCLKVIGEFHQIRFAGRDIPVMSGQRGKSVDNPLLDGYQSSRRDYSTTEKGRMLESTCL